MKRLVTAAFVVAMIASVAGATALPYVSVSGTPPFVGDTTTATNAGLVGHGNWVGSTTGSGIEISWDITECTTGKSAGLWTYTYTFTEIGGGCLSDSVCHMLLEVSSSITSSNYCTIFENANCCISAPTTYSASSCNPGLPTSFDNTNAVELSGSCSNTYSFQCTHSPMWGSFYAVDSNCSTYVWNSGIGSYPNASGPFTNWIPVPDTTATGSFPVPEPATMALLGLGLAGLLARRKIAKA